MTNHRVVVALADRDAREQYAAFVPEGYAVETASSLESARALLPGARAALLDQTFFPAVGSPAEWCETLDADCRVALVTRDDPPFDPVRAGFDAVLQSSADGDAARETLATLLRLARYDDLIYEYADRLAAEDDAESIRRALDELIAEFDDGAYAAAIRDVGGAKRSGRSALGAD